MSKTVTGLRGATYATASIEYLGPISQVGNPNHEPRGELTIRTHTGVFYEEGTLEQIRELHGRLIEAINAG